MPIVSIKVIPTGVGVSVSSYVAAAVDVIESMGFRPVVTPDTTVLRVDDLEKLGPLLKKVHDKLCSMGVKRLLTIVMIDDRRDIGEREPEELVRRVEERRAEAAKTSS